MGFFNSLRTFFTGKRLEKNAKQPTVKTYSADPYKNMGGYYNQLNQMNTGTTPKTVAPKVK